MDIESIQHIARTEHVLGPVQEARVTNKASQVYSDLYTFSDFLLFRRTLLIAEN